MKDKQKVFGIPNTIAALGRARCARYRADVERRFREQLGAGFFPQTAAMIGRKMRALQLAAMAPRPATRRKASIADSVRPWQSLRAAAVTDLVIEGLAVPFARLGFPSCDAGRSHRVARDAFRNALDGQTALVMRHTYSGQADNADEVLANTTLSSLRLWIDDTGLRFRGRLRATKLAAIAVNKINRGELAGVSATYRVDATEYGETSKLITRVRDLEELSLLFNDDRPAFPGTWARVLHVPVGVSIYSPDFADHAAATAAGSARRQLALVGRDGTRRRALTPAGG